MTPRNAESEGQQAIWSALFSLQDGRYPTQSGANWMYFCPCHEDGTKSGRRSLSICYEEDGSTKAYCFACEKGKAFYDRLASTLQLPRDSFDAPWTKGTIKLKSHNNQSQGTKVVSSHIYHDAEGNPTYKVERRIKADGTGSKFYWQYAYVDGKFHYYGGSRPKPEGATDPTIYNLPSLLAAIEKGETVYVVEGEKSADALIKAGLVATTNAGGAGKWKESYGELLTGANVVILPDNDQPGSRHAEAVAESLRGKAKSIRIVNLPGLQEKEDVYDWLSDHQHTTEELSSLAASSEEMAFGERAEVSNTPKSNEKKRTGSVFDVRFSLGDLMNMPDKGWYLEGFLAPKELVMIAGAPGIGKTFMGLDIAASLVLRKDWARHFKFSTDKPLRVDYFLGEGVSRMNKRITALLEAYDADIEQLSAGLTIFGGLPKLNEPDGLNSVVEIVQGYRERKLPIPDVIFIDTFARATAGADENSARDAGRIINAMDYLKEELGCTVVVIHHTGKNGDVRGSSAFAGGLDVMLKTVRREGGTYLTAEKIKDGELFEDIPYSLLPLAESCCIGWGEGMSHKKPKDTVLEFLRNHPGKEMTLKEIHEGAATGKSEQTTRNHLKALVGAGKVHTRQREDSSKAFIWWVQELKPGAVRVDFSHLAS